MRRMHRALKILIVALCIVVLPLSAVNTESYASPTSRTVPIYQIFTVKGGEYPEDFDFTVYYSLTPESGSGTGSEFRFPITGRSVKSQLTFSTSGGGPNTVVLSPYPERVIEYRLKPVRELTDSHVIFDGREYLITVKIGSGGIEYVICRNALTGEKTDRIEFDPWYQNDPGYDEENSETPGNPTKPDQSDGNGKKDIGSKEREKGGRSGSSGYNGLIRAVRTGDTQDIALWLLILVIAGGSLTILVVRRKKKQKGSDT